jgi:thiosulfate/3-mercaptopyruvate sulfurtransferase
MELLLTTEWLGHNLGVPDLRVIDATYYALEPGRDAAADFAKRRIPGARYLDLANLRDASDPVPGQAPSAEQFAARLGALGVGMKDRVILYDQAPHHTSARAWWLFRLFGFDNVVLLSGGLDRWEAERRPCDSGVPIAPGGGVVFANKQPGRVKTFAEMKALVADGSAQILDARSAARFSGEEPDPRPGVAPGHIPGAKNLPYDRLFNPDGTWKRGGQLAMEFEKAGVDLWKPVVATCGSGVTAAILLYGLALLGRDDWSLYDGSWSEWGADPTTPKAIGA